MEIRTRKAGAATMADALTQSTTEGAAKPLWAPSRARAIPGIERLMRERIGLPSFGGGAARPPQFRRKEQQVGADGWLSNTGGGEFVPQNPLITGTMFCLIDDFWPNPHLGLLRSVAISY